MVAARPHERGTQAVAPRALYGSHGTGSPPQQQRAWRRAVRVGAGLALGCAVVLLGLSASGRPGAAELEDVVSPPVMGTGGGPTARPADDGAELSPPVMGSACTTCGSIDGPRLHQWPSGWKNYSIDYNVFGLHVYNGGVTDADAPGALPDDGQNEWENTFKDFDFTPSHKHDGSRCAPLLLACKCCVAPCRCVAPYRRCSPARASRPTSDTLTARLCALRCCCRAGLQAEAIMRGVQHYGEQLFNGHPPPPTRQPESSPPPPASQSGGGTTLAGGAGTSGANSAASQASAIVTAADAGQAANTAAATAAESPAASPATASTADAQAGAGGANGNGGNEDGGSPSNMPNGEGASANAASGGGGDGGGGGGGVGTPGGTETGPVTGNNCFLLPDLCPQYSLPAPGFKGAGADVVHVDGEPKEAPENDGSQPQHVNPAANIASDDVLGPYQANLPSDPPPPTPAPYSANLRFDTSMDNGAAGMGEGIEVDTSADARFVGGAPIAGAEERARPTQLLLKGVERKAAVPKLQTLAEMKSRPVPAMGRPLQVAGWHAAQRPRYPLIKLSDEFEDTGEEDTSLDGDLQDVDDQLRKLLPAYDKQVGTINFGSRGMTDQRNDFLEGTSGSKFSGPATSTGGSKKGFASALFALVPTGMRVLPGARPDPRNQMLQDVPIVSCRPPHARVRFDLR